MRTAFCLYKLGNCEFLLQQLDYISIQFGFQQSLLIHQDLLHTTSNTLCKKTHFESSFVCFHTYFLSFLNAFLHIRKKAFYEPKSGDEISKLRIAELYACSLDYSKTVKTENSPEDDFR